MLSECESRRLSDTYITRLSILYEYVIGRRCEVVST